MDVGPKKRKREDGARQVAPRLDLSPRSEEAMSREYVRELHSLLDRCANDSDESMHTISVDAFEVDFDGMQASMSRRTEHVSEKRFLQMPKYTLQWWSVAFMAIDRAITMDIVAFTPSDYAVMLYSIGVVFNYWNFGIGTIHPAALWNVTAMRIELKLNPRATDTRTLQITALASSLRGVFLFALQQSVLQYGLQETFWHSPARHVFLMLLGTSTYDESIRKSHFAHHIEAASMALSEGVTELTCDAMVDYCIVVASDNSFAHIKTLAAGIASCVDMSMPPGASVAMLHQLAYNTTTKRPRINELELRGILLQSNDPMLLLVHFMKFIAQLKAFVLNISNKLTVSHVSGLFDSAFGVGDRCSRFRPEKYLIPQHFDSELHGRLYAYWNAIDWETLRPNAKDANDVYQCAKSRELATLIYMWSTWRHSGFLEMDLYDFTQDVPAKIARKNRKSSPLPHIDRILAARV